MPVSLSVGCAAALPAAKRKGHAKIGREEDSWRQRILVELVVARVAVAGLVGGGEARVVRHRLHLRRMCGIIIMTCHLLAAAPVSSRRLITDAQQTKVSLSTSTGCASRRQAQRPPRPLGLLPQRQSDVVWCRWT